MKFVISSHLRLKGLKPTALDYAILAAILADMALAGMA